MTTVNDVKRRNCPCFDDVRAMHEAKDLPRAIEPVLLDDEHMAFRLEFLAEELAEIRTAYSAADLPGILDGLIDLVYVALGTGVCMGLPWADAWREVHRANMDKQRGANASRSASTHAIDLIKPSDWRPPDLQRVLSGEKATER